MTEKLKRVALFEFENPFVLNLGYSIAVLQYCSVTVISLEIDLSKTYLFCGEDELALLQQEWREFATHFVQVNLALSCANIFVG